MAKDKRYYDDEKTQELPVVSDKKNKKKKKRKLSSEFFWAVLAIAAVVFFISFFRQPMFPRKWSWVLLAVLAGVLLLTGIFTAVLSSKNRIQKFINILLSVCLFVGSIALPYYVNRVTNLIDSATSDYVYIDLYVMSQSYRDAHPDVFANNDNNFKTPETDENGKLKASVNIKDYADAVYGTSIASDQTNQEYAVKELKESFGKQVNTVDRKTIIDSVSDLYNNKVDILIVADASKAIIEGTQEFENFDSDAVLLYQIKRKTKTTKVTGNTDLTTKPFTIFFGGNDEEGDLSLEGRTDVDMMVTVNPNTHQIAIINMPRDSYIPNPAYDGESDKLTHFGLKGIDNTLKGLSDYMDEDIRNYVVINFTTFVEIVNAMGGTLTINNPYTFTAINGTTFNEGEVTMNADFALLYCREREGLPNGDFDRAAHQQIIMQAIIDKLTSKDVITHFSDLLTNLQGKFLTNVSSDALYALCQKQLDENISWNIVKYHVTGATGNEICASAPGQELSVVYPYTNQVEFCKNVMNQIDNGEIVKQEEMPEGSMDSSSESTDTSEDSTSDNGDFYQDTDGTY